MDNRKFNGIMPEINETWGAQVLGMERINLKGPDLMGNNCFVEVKFNLIDAKKRYPQMWKVLEYRMDYPDENPGKFPYRILKQKMKKSWNL